MSRVGIPLGIATADTPLGTMRIPLHLAAKMDKLVNNATALQVGG